MLLTFDLETTNRDYGSALTGSNRVVCVAWAVDDQPVRKFYGDWMLCTEFWKTYDRATTVCAFNAKFEQLWLRRAGVDPAKKQWHDPMLAAKVVAGNRRWGFSQDALCERFDEPRKDKKVDLLISGGVCPSEIPEDWLLARVSLDVEQCRRLHARFAKILTDLGQHHLYRTRVSLMTVLSEMETNGMFLSKTLTDAVYNEHRIELGRLETRLNEITGGINLNSPDQKAIYLYQTLGLPERKNARGKPMRNKPSKQFPDGRPKTDKHTMSWLATQAKTAKQREFFELQKEFGSVKASLSKNLEFFKGVVTERGGWFHGQFSQIVTATHRLSSSGIPLKFEMFPNSKSVQFQNMPGRFKKLFKAPAGYKVVEVDAMQLEFRVAAFVGDDEQARKDISDPSFDAHCQTAAVMNDVPYPQFLAQYRLGDADFVAMRKAAKADTFKPLFGGEYGTPAQMRYYNSFKSRYSELRLCQETWLAEVRMNGFHVTDWGMRFSYETKSRHDGTLIDKSTGKPVGPRVYNAPIQSLATAEMVPMAIVALKRRCIERHLDVKFVNTIHDSVVCYVKTEHVDDFLDSAAKAFTSDVVEELKLRYELDFDVPLGIEAVVGTHWGETEREFIFDQVKEQNHE